MRWVTISCAQSRLPKPLKFSGSIRRSSPIRAIVTISLGEAYLKNGDEQLAIANYKKSIALDPGNEAGKKVLAKLLE